jgi:hypothetical protein
MVAWLDQGGATVMPLSGGEGHGICGVSVSFAHGAFLCECFGLRKLGEIIG